MAYTKQTWIAPTGTGLSRYAKSGETDTHIELALDPVNLTNTPTPITVARLNHMEDGIAEAAETATLATQALEIKPLGDSIALPTVPTPVTRIIKIATIDWSCNGTINMLCSGSSIVDEIKVYINGAQNAASGIRVIYGKISVNNGIKKIKVTRATGEWNSTRNIYAEISTTPNGSATTTLGVVETNRGTFTPSMTEVSSVDGTVVDSLSLDYSRGDISSCQHVFTKNIIANLTGNAGNADKWKTARNITISDADGTNTGTEVAVDGSENETLKLPATIKASLTGNADTVSKANVRVSLRHGNTWFDKTWADLASFDGYRIWTDGENIYHSDGSNHFVLNKTTSTWTAKTWKGLTDFIGRYIWTDGDNIYYSYEATQYVLNKATSTWTAKTWTGLTSFNGQHIWTDGDNIYYSSTTTQYVLNKATSTWTAKTWTGLTSFNGYRIWTDGDNIYYSSGTNQFVLNKTTSTWTIKTWNGLDNLYGDNNWTDGDNIYHSDGTNQFVLNKTTSTWTIKTWTGLTEFDGYRIWTDGENIYSSNSTTQYVLPATRHNYVDDAKYNSLFGTVTKCNCSTLSDRFVFRNE